MKTRFVCKVSVRAFAICLSLMTLCGCDLIDYHPYDTRVSGSHNLTRHNIERIEQSCAGRDSLRFVLISDTQRWYDETEAAVESINKRGDVDFVVHCGDISDFGVTREFELQRDILEKLTMPYVVLIGNHDCLGSGAETYSYIFGTANFSFNAGFLHVACLNTNAFEYDYSTAVPDFSFIKGDYSATPDSVTATVVAMHAQPYSDQFNNNVVEVFEAEVLKYRNPLFCMCGHGHSTQVNEWFGDGMKYFEITAAKNREYMVFTVRKNGDYSYEYVQY